MKPLAVALVALSLTGCAGSWMGPTPAQQQARNMCPPQLMQQAQWVQRNVTRLQLGGTRQQTAQVLGLPLQVESFLLRDNSAVTILFYPTPEVCQSGAANASNHPALMPVVFQGDKLLGYGQNYYQHAIVPALGQPLALPFQQPEPAAGPVPGRTEPVAPIAQPTVREEPIDGQPALGRGTPLNIQ